MRLFCYGTLVFPDILRRVCGARAAGRPAVLQNHACYSVQGCVYPGVVPEPGARTHGVVYDSIDYAQLRRLDRYEGDEYERRRVFVSLADGRLCRAWTYLMREDAGDRLTEEHWDRAQFAQRHLASYLRALAE